jgi:transposase-like protein
MTAPRPSRKLCKGVQETGRDKSKLCISWTHDLRETYHEGLLAAVGELFSATPRQRCLVHKQRNVMSAIPRREREEVQAELSGIWKQEKKEAALANLQAFKAKYTQRYPEAIRSLAEDEEHLLTFYAFPFSLHFAGQFSRLG